PRRVEEPRADELNIGLRALLLEEALKLVIAVAFGRHRPEFADDADLGLGDRAIDFHRFEERLALPQRRQNGRTTRQRVADDLLPRPDGAIGAARVPFGGAEAVAERVDDVARHERLHDRPKKRGVQLEPRLFAGRLRDALLLLEEHDAEAVEA